MTNTTISNGFKSVYLCLVFTGSSNCVLVTLLAGTNFPLLYTDLYFITGNRLKVLWGRSQGVLSTSDSKGGGTQLSNVPGLPERKTFVLIYN